MKFTTSIHLNNWYGITANAGDEIEVPDNLVTKAESMDFLNAKKGRKSVQDSD